MNPNPAAFAPFVSAFETEAQEAAYTTWLKAKVAASLADTREPIPHSQVMAEIDAIILEEGVSAPSSSSPAWRRYA